MPDGSAVRIVAQGGGSLYIAETDEPYRGDRIDHHPRLTRRSTPMYHTITWTCEECGNGIADGAEREFGAGKREGPPERAFAQSVRFWSLPRGS